MADNKPMTRREREALDNENTGNPEKTKRVIAARFAKQNVRAGHERTTASGGRRRS